MTRDDIKKLTDGELIVEYAKMCVIFYKDINEKNSLALTMVQDELLERGLISTYDMCRLG